MSVSRPAFVKAVIDLMGLPYLWDGKGLPTEPYRGRDCSGTVTSSLQFIGGPDLRDTYNVAKMWAELPHIQQADALPGDLVVWGIPDGKGGFAPDHVMTWLSIGTLVVGAAGGDSTTTTQAEAVRRGARVQTWATLPDGPNFKLLGFLRSSWLDSGVPVS